MSWKGFIPDNAIVMRRRRATEDARITSEPLAADSVDSLLDAPTLRHPAVSADAPPTMTASDSIAAIADDLSRLIGTRLISQGEPSPSLVFVAQGPAPYTDAESQLLEKMIAAMGVPRSKVHLLNLVTPGATAVASKPFLDRAFALLRPRVVVALGTLAAQSLLESERPISGLRGKFHEGAGFKLMATFHPADLLRAPDAKREAWEDLKQVAKELALAKSQG
jgi:DNA polymerase